MSERYFKTHIALKIKHVLFVGGFPVNVALGKTTWQDNCGTSGPHNTVDGIIAMQSGSNGAPLDVVRATCASYKTVTWRVYLSKQLSIGYILLYSSVASKYNIMRLRALLNILNAIFVHCATPPFDIQRHVRDDENTMCPVRLQ